MRDVEKTFALHVDQMREIYVPVGLIRFFVQTVRQTRMSVEKWAAKENTVSTVEVILFVRNVQVNVKMNGISLLIDT